MVVGFEQVDYTYQEGNSAASVCLEIQNLLAGAGGIEIEIAITITTADVTAGLCSDVLFVILEQLEFSSVLQL